jgi:hypothetical protein
MNWQLFPPLLNMYNGFRIGLVSVLYRRITMRSVLRAIKILALTVLLNVPWMPGAVAKDSDDPNPASSPQVAASPEDATQTSVLSEEEMNELLTRVDAFFTDQDMMDLTVDLDLFRDPSGRLNSKNIRETNPSRLAGLSTIICHYVYTAPAYYQLTIMNEVLAGSDVPPDRTFYSQLLPMPGAPIFTADIRSRFTIRSEGMEDVEGIPAYKIRYTAKDYETEFFDYLVYYIEPNRKVILRVQGSFDNVWYKGVADGNFYYDEWLGKYLPIYGHGSVLNYPDQRMNIWGRWYKWKWRSAEELAESTKSQ